MQVLLKKAMPDNLSTVELQLNSLREQYRKLQEDFNAKVEEVSMVRVEYEAAKRDALSLQDKCREAEARVDDLLERLRVIELEKTKVFTLNLILVLYEHYWPEKYQWGSWQSRNIAFWAPFLDSAAFKAPLHQLLAQNPIL